MPDSGNKPARQAQGTVRRWRVAQRNPPGGVLRGNDPAARRRLRSLLASANRLVLAAVAAGIAGIITAAVIAVPHVLAVKLSPSSPFTIVGGASPGLHPSRAPGSTLRGIAPGTSPCWLDGEYVVAGNVGVHGTITTSDVASLVAGAAVADVTTGKYVLQAGTGQTAVLTGIHTVLLRRVPARSVPATVVVVGSRCTGASRFLIEASIDLDAADVTPHLAAGDGETTQMKPVTDLAAIVAQDQPVVFDFNAATTRFDVTWQLRFDYTTGGRSLSATLPAAGQQFQTDAIAPGDSWLWLTLNSDGSTWSATTQTAAQKTAADRADAAAGVADDYATLSHDRAVLEASPRVPVDPGFIGRDLPAVIRDERYVLGEAGRVSSTVCDDAGNVLADAQRVASDAQQWASNSVFRRIAAVRSDASGLTADLGYLLQLDPRFSGNSTVPPPAALQQAAVSALTDAARAAQAAPTVNAMISKVNAAVARAWALATAAAAAGGQACPVPGPAPQPIPREA